MGNEYLSFIKKRIIVTIVFLTGSYRPLTFQDVTFIGNLGSDPGAWREHTRSEWNVGMSRKF